MKDKKGFLLVEETLKIVIAVICIGFLVYFLVSLYFTNKSSEDLEQAEASLNHLMNEIDAGRTEIEIYNPKGLWIISWPYKSEKGEVIPNSCSNVGWENCICICEKRGPVVGAKIGPNIDFDWTSKECDSNWVCKESSERIIVGNEKKQAIKIEKPPLILIIDYENNMIIKK